MKRALLWSCMVLVLFALGGCTVPQSEQTEENNNEEVNMTDTDTDSMKIDFDNAESFETALNEGEAVKNKIVKFDVAEYKPDSAMGINCWSGEHLNFISDEELDVNKGDIVIGRITDEPSKSFGSWEIHYEVLNIEKISLQESEESVEEQESTETTSSNGKIRMPYSSDYYLGSEWTFESLSKHFTELGFTNIIGVECDPDEDNYKMNIVALEISYRFGKEDPWNEGDEFKPDRAICIYYNSPALLTIDNSESLQKILTSEDISYDTFCSTYDNYYVEFEAVVVSHLTYDGDTSHIIDVKGPDETGLLIRIGDRTWDNNIDYSVQPGNTVIVSGKISNRWAEYYKQVYVETLSLSRK